MTHTLLSCPACSAQYNIPNAAIAATGRRVKCTACGYNWQVFPNLPIEAEPSTNNFAEVMSEVISGHMSEPADMAMLAPQMEAQSESEQEPESDQASAALLAQALSRQGVEVNPDFSPKTFSFNGILQGAMVALITMLLLLGGGFVALHSQSGLKMATAWGQGRMALVPALQALGVAVPVVGEGLVFENVVVERQLNKPTLVVSGQWRNRTTSPIVVPNLQVGAVANPTDPVPLKTWPIAQKPLVITPKGVAQFKYELPQAPSNAAHVRLSFY